jgi:hypothetical protein
VSKAHASERTTKEVFDRYASELDDYAFNRTHVVVNLARQGGVTGRERSRLRRDHRPQAAQVY